MFVGKAKEIERLVEKHHWDKIGKKLEGADAQTKCALAVACGGSHDEAAANCLINLLKDSDEDVQLKAVESLELVGSESAKTHLMWLYGKLPEEQEAIRKAILDAIEKIGKRR